MISITSQIPRTSSWEDIVNFDSLASGDIIAITLKDGTNLDLEVAHDEKGKQFIVFRDCLPKSRAMNRTNTNVGGWRDSDMRKYAGEVFELLPDDLQAIIVPTKIVQVINGARIECADKLFCLSYTQVFGANRRCDEPEDSQMDIYKRRRNRAKEFVGQSESWCSWWLRSPYTGCATSFYTVYLEGYGGNNASYSNGVCFGFCIQSENLNSEEEAAT